MFVSFRFLSCSGRHADIFRRQSGQVTKKAIGPEKNEEKLNLGIIGGSCTKEQTHLENYYINMNQCTIPPENTFTMSMKRSVGKSNQTTPTDQDKQLSHVLLLVIAALIVTVNVYVLSLFIRNRETRKNKSNILLICLAVADLISGSINAPLLVISEMAKSSKSPYSQEIHKVADFVTVGCSAVTMLSMCNIVGDRYLAICHNMTYSSMVSRRRIFILILFSWLIPLLFTLVRLLWWISPSAMENAIKWDELYYIVGCCLYFIVIVLLLILFIRMYIAIQRLRKNEKRFVLTNQTCVLPKREIKAIILFAVMYFAFLFCWTPVVVLRLIATKDIAIFNRIPHRVVQSIPVVRFLTSILNPLIYTIHKYDIYRAAAADFRNLSLKVNHIFPTLCTGYVRAPLRRTPSNPKSRVTEVSRATPATTPATTPDLDQNLRRDHETTL